MIQFQIHGDQKTNAGQLAGWRDAVPGRRDGVEGVRDSPFVVPIVIRTNRSPCINLRTISDYDSAQTSPGLQRCGSALWTLLRSGRTWQTVNDVHRMRVCMVLCKFHSIQDIIAVSNLPYYGRARSVKRPTGRSTRPYAEIIKKSCAPDRKKRFNFTPIS